MSELEQCNKCGIDTDLESMQCINPNDEGCYEVTSCNDCNDCIFDKFLIDMFEQRVKDTRINMICNDFITYCEEEEWPNDIAIRTDMNITPGREKNE